MKRKTLGIVMVAMPLMVAGCLQKETTHTLYLSPDGAVAWTVFEMEVRSDERDAAKRRAEEREYLTAATTGSHGTGRGLAALEPVSTRTRVLRAERPYTVLTEGSFRRIDELLERMLAELRLPGHVRLTRDGTRTTLAIHVDVSSDDDDGEESAVTELLEDFDRYRVVLTAGRFVAASGFRLMEDGRAAEPIAISGEEAEERGWVFDLSLTWDVVR